VNSSLYIGWDFFVLTLFDIGASSQEEARKLLFNELHDNEFSDEIRQIYACSRAWHVLEDLEENKVVEVFGEKDSIIIIQISGGYLDLSAEKQKVERTF